MKTYTGSCHCGRVKFKADMVIDKAMECNCSICTKRGSLLAFIPEEDFTLVSGEEALTEYLFNKMIIHHYFCKFCGILPFAKGKAPDGKMMRGINLRCIDGIDLEKIPKTMFNGKDM